MIFRQLFDSTVRHLHLSARQPARRRGADHRSGAGARGSLPSARARAGPEAGQGGGYAPPRRSCDRARSAARPHPLHHGDGRADPGRRGVHARGGRRPHRNRGIAARRAVHARPHRRFLLVRVWRPRLHRRHAADSRHRPHRFPERRSARAVRFDLQQAPQAAGRNAGLSRHTTTRATPSRPSARRSFTTRGSRSNRSTNTSTS